MATASWHPPQFPGSRPRPTIVFRQHARLDWSGSLRLDPQRKTNKLNHFGFGYNQIPESNNQNNAFLSGVECGQSELGLTEFTGAHLPVATGSEPQVGERFFLGRGIVNMEGWNSQRKKTPGKTEAPSSKMIF
jgi:hypothetical protein